MNKIRTDLAIEAHEMCSRERAKKNHLDGIDVQEYNDGGVSVTAIKIRNEQGADILGKPVGRYITIESPQLKYSNEIYEKTCITLSEYIKKLHKINENTKTLVVGLGNKSITPDALGPQVISKLIITNHVKSHNYFDNSYSSVCALSPGVLGTTGIETSDIIKGVAEKISPDLIIAVDALASRSIDRISTTIQISDTGINPGSGVHNKRCGINREILGIPVIAIGVPTVVDASTIAVDCIEATFGESEIYTDGRDRQLIYGTISKKTGNMMVTPKDIDLVIERTAKTVANGINLALHGDLTFEDIENYVG